MNLSNICCCCRIKNDDKNVNLNSKKPSIRIPSISVTVTPEPIEPEDKNKPIFIKKSNIIEQSESIITVQPTKNNLTVKTIDKNIELKAKKPSSYPKNDEIENNIEKEIIINESDDISCITEIDDLRNKYKGHNNFAFADEIDGNCKIQIGTYENGKEVKKIIEWDQNNNKIQYNDGNENHIFELNENENEIINHGEITPPLENEPSFEERRRSIIEKSMEKFLDHFHGNLQPIEKKTTNNIISSEQPPIIHRSTITTTTTTTKTAPITQSDDIYKNIRLSCLETHNRLRTQHGCPPLKENDELNKYADEWANYLSETSSKLIHRPNNKYGENLYWTNNRNGHVTMAVHAWYDEIKLYNFTNHGFSKECGHFTQLIWRDTVELGTGVARKGNEMIVVCNYNPPGNYNGEFNDYSVPSLIAEDELTNDMIRYYKERIRESSLTAHNRLRSLHGSPPLQRSNELDRAAEQMLDYIEYNNGKTPKLPDNLDVARNYFISNYPFMHITLAIQEWYNDGIKSYNYDKPSTDNNNNVNGFIQLIWRDTIQLGTAIKRIDKQIHIMCLYTPGRRSLDMYSDYLVPRLITHKLNMPLEMYPEQMRWSCLEAHNRLRDLHGCPPLVRNSDLDQFAEEWAKHLANVNKLYHRSNSKYGENLYWSSDKFAHVTMAVQNWYNEIKLYDFNNPGFSEETGHFTQLVWKDSVFIGTGIARRGDSLYVVCVYNPPGNFVGRFNDYYIPRPIPY